MTPKEKAKELFDKYVKLSGIYVGDYENEKQMCLIAVDEIIDTIKTTPGGYFMTIYWQDVKKEIKKKL